jgi:hypothetical protein
MMLKHDIAQLGHLDNSLGFYRFRYKDSEEVYVGVMVQEVQTTMPAAVVRGSDGTFGFLMTSYGVRRMGDRLHNPDQLRRSPTALPRKDSCYDGYL